MKILWIDLVVRTECNQCERITAEVMKIDDYDFSDLNGLADEITATLESDRRQAVLCERCADKFRAEVAQGGENPYLNDRAARAEGS